MCSFYPMRTQPAALSLAAVLFVPLCCWDEWRLVVTLMCVIRQKEEHAAAFLIDVQIMNVMMCPWANFRVMSSAVLHTHSGSGTRAALLLVFVFLFSPLANGSCIYNAPLRSSGWFSLLKWSQCNNHKWDPLINPPASDLAGFLSAIKWHLPPN